MRLTAVAGLFALTVFVAANNSTASAQTLDIGMESTVPVIALETKKIETPKQIKKEDKSKPIKHVVVDGDNLSKIAAKYKTTWQRIYDKNTQLANPDVINTGETLTIPSAKEKLTERPAADRQNINSTNANQASYAAQYEPSSYQATNPSSGNSYTPGYCTWYAKNMRSDLPNNLGNADTWVYRAASQGLATGSAPRVGAIGQQGMHVVFVEKVNSNGTVTVSEMNYEGYGVVSSRTVPASTFTYIY